jgi:hypothetical protein
MLIFESHSIQFRLPNLDLSCEKNAHLTEYLSQNTKQQSQHLLSKSNRIQTILKSGKIRQTPSTPLRKPESIKSL